MRLARDIIAESLKEGMSPLAARGVAADIQDRLESEGFTIHPPGFKDAINAEVARLNDIILSESRRAEDAHGEAQREGLKVERLISALKTILSSPAINSLCGWYSELEMARSLLLHKFGIDVPAPRPPKMSAGSL